MAKKKAVQGFEASLLELQTVVERMESGNLSLEESLADFEKGIRLTRECQKALVEAEQKVQMLIEKDNTIDTVPFEMDK